MRYWDNRQTDDGAVHTFGNGEMLAFARGPNLMALAGPPYTSPDILSLTLEHEEPLNAYASREPGAAIWNHTLGYNSADDEDEGAASFTEFMLPDQPVYVRLVHIAYGSLRWVLRFNAASEVVSCRDIPAAWLGVLRPGQTIMFYGDSEWHYHWVILRGACDASLTAQGQLTIIFQPGESALYIVGASQLGVGKLIAEQMVESSEESLLGSTRRYWADFTTRRQALTVGQCRYDDEAASALDDAAILLKTSQSTDGGLIAAPPFRYAYLRDGYGAARGLLALGMHAEARGAIAFRKRKYDLFGTLQTAESLGHDRIRHVHENDDVETTSYMILQVRDYLNATGDLDFVRSLWQMLAFCWQTPLKHLVNGMLPFNGDETYVAGGFYPRYGLNQGSADCTLAFIEAGRWLIPWARQQGFMTASQAAQAQSAVAEARAAYRQRFFSGDRIWANAPEREEAAPMPRFRHGVCANCTTRRFGWLERSANGRYLCSICFNTADLPAARLERMEVFSVSMLAAYLGSDILSVDETRSVVEHVLAQAQPDGTISSVPGHPGFVGYDPALISMNLTAIIHPAVEDGYRRLLKERDSTGVWVEYYTRDGQPDAHCSRARTWETGVSIDAIVRYWALPVMIARHEPRT